MKLAPLVQTAFAVLAAVIFGLALPIAQLVAAVQGINHEWGGWWAWGAVFLAIAFRFTLPLAIGAFFGATEVWGWHWALALLFVAPVLALMIQGLPAALVEFASTKFRRDRA
jgi:hypothetical protein